MVELTAKTPRGRILEKLMKLTEGARNKTHGDAVGQHKCAADFFNLYLNYKDPNIRNGMNFPQLDAADVCMLIILLKISRTLSGSRKEVDHYLDIAGYAAIAGETIADNIP